MKALADDEGEEIPLWEQRRSEWLQQRFVDMAAHQSTRAAAVIDEWPQAKKMAVTMAAKMVVTEKLRMFAGQRPIKVEVSV